MFKNTVVWVGQSSLDAQSLECTQGTYSFILHVELKLDEGAPKQPRRTVRILKNTVVWVNQSSLDALFACLKTQEHE